MELNILTIVTLCLVSSFLLGEIFYRLKYPRMIGQIIAGILLGQFLLSLFTPKILEVVDFLADLGIIFLLLIVGLELDLPKFRKTSKDSIIMGIFCFLLPFTLGFILMKAFGSTDLAAIVVGACLAITAEGTTLNLLIDLKALNTKVGNITLGAGIIDDVFELVFLMFVLIFAGETSTVGIESPNIFFSIIMKVVQLAVFVGAVYLLYKFMPRILDTIQKEKSRVATFSAVLIIALVIAILSKTSGHWWQA
jgi:Kef-type K+ transport system membrane component KefB